MSGVLDILNCGAGHLSFKFDKDNDAEVAKARKVITDMMQRGYSILVETAKGLRRVKRFDPKRDEYVIEEPQPPAKPATRRLPMRSTRATAVGRTAGG